MDGPGTLQGRRPFQSLMPERDRVETHEWKANGEPPHDEEPPGERSLSGGLAGEKAVEKPAVKRENQEQRESERIRNSYINDTRRPIVRPQRRLQKQDQEGGVHPHQERAVFRAPVLPETSAHRIESGRFEPAADVGCAILSRFVDHTVPLLSSGTYRGHSRWRA